MMKKYYKKIEVIAFFIAALIGNLGHFFYEWSNNNYFIGLFFPVNESVWEHLKLIFFPIMIVAVYEKIMLSNEKNILWIKVKSALLAMMATVAMYYTFVGIVGKNIDFVNIVIYFAAMIIAYVYSYYRLIRVNNCNCYWIALAVAIIITLMFIRFSYNPLKYGIFSVP